MKASQLNLIKVASVLSSLSAPLSPSSWGLCVLGGGDGRPHTHLERRLKELQFVQISLNSTPLSLFVCLCVCSSHVCLSVRQVFTLLYLSVFDVCSNSLFQVKIRHNHVCFSNLRTKKLIHRRKNNEDFLEVLFCISRARDLTRLYIYFRNRRPKKYFSVVMETVYSICLNIVHGLHCMTRVQMILCFQRRTSTPAPIYLSVCSFITASLCRNSDHIFNQHPTCPYSIKTTKPEPFAEIKGS